ncbi:MAG: amino acid permease [Alphaproteobacteria bacterium]|nr:MAG: amino acid permease [Alphaproteobacteria bacterium]
MTDVKLKRSLSLSLVVLYGLGTIVGAGVYALIGEIAATAGVWAPLSFVFASLLAGFSAISLAELSSRYPKSAGEAVYVLNGFGSRSLSSLVGLFVILSGIVSAATVLNGFVGYLQDLLPVSRAIAIVGIGVLIGLIAAIGIGASVGIAAVITVIEVGALCVIIYFGLGSLPELPRMLSTEAEPFSMAVAFGVASATVPAFYAFIGFEDMVNVAEEVKNPRHNLPRAIFITMALTALIYVLIAVVAIAAVPLETLAHHGAPLTIVYEQASGRSGAWISGVGIFAMLNGALVQVIMAARVFYGLAQQGSLPKIIGRVHPKTQTPIIATVLASGIVIVIALVGSLGTLARVTSIIILIVFTLVNLALLRIKAKDPRPQSGARTYSALWPLCGAVASFAVVIWQLSVIFAGNAPLAGH